MGPNHKSFYVIKAYFRAWVTACWRRLGALEVIATPRLGTFDLQPCKLLRDQIQQQQPVLSHDQRAALSLGVCVSLFPRSSGQSRAEWRSTSDGSPPHTPANCVSVRGPLSVDAEHTQTHRQDPRTTMLTRVKSAVANFMGGMMAGGSNGDHSGGSDLPLKYPYNRPEFLGLSPDEVECSADHTSRPIVIVKETKRLPWSTGYAEWVTCPPPSIFPCA